MIEFCTVFIFYNCDFVFCTNVSVSFECTVGAEFAVKSSAQVTEAVTPRNRAETLEECLSRNIKAPDDYSNVASVNLATF